MEEEKIDEYYKLVIKEFNGLKKKISMMPANIKRSFLYENYANLLSFMGRIGIPIDMDLIELEDSDKFDYLFQKTKIEDVAELGQNIELLQAAFQEVIGFYNDNNLITANFSSNTKINERGNIGRIIYEFFASIDMDLLKLFRQCYENGNLVFANIEGAGGITFPLHFAKSSKVIVSGNLNMLDTYHTLVHEMGHVYHTYLRRNNESFHGFEPTCEVVSMLFEKLFCRFLKDHYYYPKQTEVLLKTERLAYLNMLVHSDIICELLKRDMGMIAFDDLSIITPLDDEQVKDLLTRNCHYIIKDDGTLNLYNFSYAIGDIISSYFYKKIMEDKASGLKELQAFAANSERLSLEEIIKRYMSDLTPIKDYIKEQFEDQKSKKLVKE